MQQESSITEKLSIRLLYIYTKINVCVYIYIRGYIYKYVSSPTKALKLKKSLP